MTTLPCSCKTRKAILFATARFLSLLGMKSVRMSFGRPLTEFVALEYVELVENNLRRRLAGESAAERYEIELMDRQGRRLRAWNSSSTMHRQFR